MQMQLMQFSYFGGLLNKKSVIVGIWRSTSNFDELQCNGSKKSWKKTVLYEDKSNPQLEFNKMQKGSDRISSTSQAVQTGSHSVCIYSFIFFLISSDMIFFSEKRPIQRSRLAEKLLTWVYCS